MIAVGLFYLSGALLAAVCLAIGTHYSRKATE